MFLEDTLTTTQKSLETEGISYAIIGGFALAAYGVARATQDIDILIDENDADRAKEQLTQAGFKIVFSTEEVLHFSGVGQLDILLARRPLAKEILRDAKRIGEFPGPVVSAEAIIGLKIQAYKNEPRREFRDKADIQSLISNESLQLDYDKIKTYADLFGEWKTIQAMRLL